MSNHHRFVGPASIGAWYNPFSWGGGGSKKSVIAGKRRGAASAPPPRRGQRSASPATPWQPGSTAQQPYADPYAQQDPYAQYQQPAYPGAPYQAFDPYGQPTYDPWGAYQPDYGMQAMMGAAAAAAEQRAVDAYVQSPPKWGHAKFRNRLPRYLKRFAQGVFTGLQMRGGKPPALIVGVSPDGTFNASAVDPGAFPTMSKDWAAALKATPWAQAVAVRVFDPDGNLLWEAFNRDRLSEAPVPAAIVASQPTDAP